MSSTGIRRQRSTDSRVADSILDDDRIQIESEKIFKETGDANGANSPGISNVPTAAGNFLSKAGDTRRGPMGDEFGIVEIINDTIQVDITSGNYFPVLLLNGEGGADDTLSTIIPGETIFSNRELIVQAAAQTITISPVGSIVTPDGGNVILSVGNYAKLRYSQLLSAWVVVWVSSSSGGGGGLSEPVQLTFNEITPQTLPTKTTIDAGISNVFHIIIDRDIEFEIINPPPVSKEEGLRIIIDIDGTGGYAEPIWPPSLPNPPQIPTTADTRFTVVLYTIDEGIIWTHATSVGSSSSGGVSTLSGLTIDVNKDWQAAGVSNFGPLTGVKALSMVGVTATIQFLANINFLETNQFINSLATGLDYKVDTLQDHTFRSINGDFLALTEVNPTDRRLDIKQNRVTNIGKLTFSPTFDLDIAATAEIYETLTLGNLRYVSNNAHVFVQEGIPTLLSIGNFAGNGGLVQDIALLNFNSLSGEFLLNNGDFQLDGIDMKVFSGNAIRNLSAIGVVAGGADVFLSNLSSPTSINQNLIPQAGKTLGDSSNLWSSIHVNNVRLGTAGVVNPTSNQILGTPLGIDFNIPSGIGANYEFLTGGAIIGTISDSGTLNFPFAIINTAISLGDASSFPGNNGDMYREGADVKIFSGGIERNISDLTGAGANVFLSNLSSPTAINQDLIPNGSFELGSLSDRWNTLFTQFLDVTNTALFGGDVILGNVNTDGIFMTGSIRTNITFSAILGNTIDFFESTNNAISSGPADNVPNAPLTYIKVKVNGVNLVIPAFLET